MHLLAAAALLVSTAAMKAAEADAMAANTMYSAWKCSIYAELKGDADEQGRQSALGYEKGKQFMDAAVAGTIAAEDGRTIVPMVVGLLMVAPTPEFVLGRIFESAAGDAHDDVTTEDASGMPLAPEDYVTDDEPRAIIASNKYSSANCEILQ